MSRIKGEGRADKEPKARLSANQTSLSFSLPLVSPSRLTPIILTIARPTTANPPCMIDPAISVLRQDSVLTSSPGLTVKPAWLYRLTD